VSHALNLDNAKIRENLANDAAIRSGLASLCVGGGMGIALALQSIATDSAK